MKYVKPALFFSLLVTIGCASIALAGQAAKRERHESRSILSDDNNWTWRHQDNDKKVEVSIRNEVEFNDDYSDIKRFGENGSIRIIDEHDGHSRKFEASATRRSYTVDGQSRDFDGEARAWLARLIKQTVVKGGYDAKPRVRRILHERGAEGVLEAISELDSDYVKRIYFEELVESGQLDRASARRAIEQAGREIGSDYEKANVLIKVSDRFLDDRQVQMAYVAAVSSVHSDYERGRVLASLLDKKDIATDTLLLTVRAGRTMGSDYEKARLLIKVASVNRADGAVRDAVVDAARTIGSDYERGRVLNAVFK